MNTFKDYKVTATLDDQPILARAPYDNLDDILTRLDRALTKDWGSPRRLVVKVSLGGVPVLGETQLRKMLDARKSGQRYA